MMREDERRMDLLPRVNKTLIDMIRDEERHGSLFEHRDKKSWKAFRDRLRLKRAGAAWTSSIPIPASDIPVQSNTYGSFNTSSFSNNRRSLISVRSTTALSSCPSPLVEEGNGIAVVSASRPHLTRRSSTRFAAVVSIPHESRESQGCGVANCSPRSLRPQIMRHNSTRLSSSIWQTSSSEVSNEDPQQEVREDIAAEFEGLTSLSIVEEVSDDMEAEEEESLSDEVSEPLDGPTNQPVRMSLLDLLEETDRKMGLVGSYYTAVNGQQCEDEDDKEDGHDGVECTCCVCMVRHKGAAFIPCGHTFCRLCSRELWAQRGNCPLCNGFILEILDIF